MPSTVVKSFSYDPDHKRLRVIYTSGSVYDYRNVPEEKYTAMKNAFSKGTYLNTHIKGHYRFEKVGEGSE